jgi:hypothetical protein
MELRRKYKQKLSSAGDNKIEEKNPLERVFSFAALYWLLSNYGEEPRIPLGIVAITFALGTLGFLHLQASSMGSTTYDVITTNSTAISESMQKLQKHSFLSFPCQKIRVGLERV